MTIYSNIRKEKVAQRLKGVVEVSKLFIYVYNIGNYIFLATFIDNLHYYLLAQTK